MLAKAKSVVMSDEMVDYITEQTYRYYMERNTDTSYTDSLHAELDRVNTATANLIRAMEAGIFNDTTKIRMEELDTQKEELEAALANAELVSGLRLTQEHIKVFLLQFRQLDFDEPDSQRRIIDIFINAVFVYDDKVTITFNYSGDNRTITLADIFSRSAAPPLPAEPRAHCLQTAVLPYYAKQSPAKKTCGRRHGGQPCLLPH